MKKKVFLVPAVLLLLLLTVFPSLAAVTFSSAWYQSGSNWCVTGPDGRQLKNAWFCDDAVSANGKNVWYLIDDNGYMVSSPLVQDGTGNYYSLETQHNGYYGSLRYQSGWYDGVYLSFSQSHNGTFGAIINPDGIQALQEKYGCTDVSHINNNNCFYSSSWIGTGSYSGNRTISYYTNGKKYASKTGKTDTFTIINCGDYGFQYWQEHSTGDRYYPDEEYVFEGNLSSTRMNAVYKAQQEARSLNYFIDGKIYRSVTETGNTTTVIGFPEDKLDGRIFINWKDDEGNRWEPGEVYTFYTNIDFMNAVFAGEE